MDICKQLSNNNPAADDDSDEDDIDYVPPPETAPRQPNIRRLAAKSVPLGLQLSDDDDSDDDSDDDDDESAGEDDDSTVNGKSGRAVAKRRRVDDERETEHSYGHISSESDRRQVDDLWVRLTAGLEAKEPANVADESYFSQWLQQRAAGTDSRANHPNKSPIDPHKLPNLAVLEARQRRLEQRGRQKQHAVAAALNAKKPANRFGLLDDIVLSSPSSSSSAPPLTSTPSAATPGGSTRMSTLLSTQTAGARPPAPPDTPAPGCTLPPPLKKLKTKGSGEFGTSDNRITSASHNSTYHAKGTGVAPGIPRPRGMSGLEIVLSLIRGQDPDTLLDRTKRAWNEYKTDAPDIRDELEDHKKDKSRYTSKVAFLERSDVREWEYEQKGRKPTKPTMTGGRHL